jgi:hypothetical protein
LSITNCSGRFASTVREGVIAMPIMSLSRQRSQLLASVVACCIMSLSGWLIVGAETNARLTGDPGDEKAMSPAWLAQLEQWHRTIKPQSDESQFAQIPWVSTVAEARSQAAEEGKPIFIWYMVGEPLGQC